MDLNSGRLITRQHVWEIPVTDVVINAVEKMGEEQEVKSLKLQNHRRDIFYPTDWIAGVDYAEATANDDENQKIDEDYENENHPFEDDLDEEDAFDHIDQEEIDELLADAHQTDNNVNPINVAPLDNDPGQPVELDDNDEPDEDVPLRRQPSRVRNPPDRLTYSQMTSKVVRFAEKEAESSCHFLGTPTILPEAIVEEYSPQYAMVIARYMTDINAKVTIQGVTFSQQYILQKGLKKLEQRGTQAALKELDQLHRHTCFTPVDVSSLSAEEKQKAQEALMFLTEKRDKTVKGRLVYNGKPTHEW